MEFEEYQKKTTEIHEQLQDIAELTMKQALSGTANADNASFVHLMKRHQQLLEKGKILTDSMMKELSIE